MILEELKNGNALRDKKKKKTEKFSAALHD